MIDILEYLQKYYTESTVGLEEKMAEEFGVDVKRSPAFPKLWLFKYNQIAVKWTRLLPHKCRGIILEYDSGTWKLVSYPFDKFFNLHEPQCALTPEDYAACPDNYSLVEKADGTCIQVYKYEDDWRVSTLGTIVTEGYNSDVSFEDLFWLTIKRHYGLTREQVCENLIDECTFVFELCTSQNRIVTRYKSDRVYLLGVRELEYGLRLWTRGEVEDAANNIGVRATRWYSCYDYKTLKELREFVEEEGRNETVAEDEDVQYPEGYVIYQSGRPMAKVKNARYLVLHLIMGGENDRYISKCLAEAVFQESLDDIMEALSEAQIAGVEYMQEMLRQINATAIRMGNILHELLEKCEVESSEVRKLYAQEVQKLVKDLPDKPRGWISGYFFRNMDKVREGFLGSFLEHIKAEAERTKENLGYWRDCILEGIEKFRNEQDS